MIPPRLHSNLRTNAQEATRDAGFSTETAHLAPVESAVNQGPSKPDRTQTAHARGQKPHTPSDRLPTDQSETSDKRAGYQAFERKLDTRFKRVAADLDMCSQVRAAGTTVQAADANALRLPVSESGKALTEDPAGAYRRDYAHASRIVGLERRVQAKTAIVAEAELEYKLIHRARRKPEDLGVEDGRLKVARYARTHGTRAAAIAFCLDPSDPKSVERMQRNARNYLKELAAKEAIK